MKTIKTLGSKVNGGAGKINWDDPPPGDLNSDCGPLSLGAIADAHRQFTGSGLSAAGKALLDFIESEICDGADPDELLPELPFTFHRYVIPFPEGGPPYSNLFLLARGNPDPRVWEVFSCNKKLGVWRFKKDPQTIIHLFHQDSDGEVWENVGYSLSFLDEDNWQSGLDKSLKHLTREQFKEHLRKEAIADARASWGCMYDNDPPSQRDYLVRLIGLIDATTNPDANVTSLIGAASAGLYGGPHLGPASHAARGPATRTKDHSRQAKAAMCGRRVGVGWSLVCPRPENRKIRPRSQHAGPAMPRRASDEKRLLVCAGNAFVGWRFNAFVGCNRKRKRQMAPRGFREELKWDWRSISASPNQRPTTTAWQRRRSATMSWHSGLPPNTSATCAISLNLDAGTGGIKTEDAGCMAAALILPR
jgi:hypothetical protein